MNPSSSSRQHQILTLLLHEEAGLSIEELSSLLDISRNAIKQHLNGLEKQQLVQEAALTSTGGRPARKYTLTDLGRDQFPKQYSWFSQLLLGEIFNELTIPERERLMRNMGLKLATSLAPQFAGKSDEARAAALIELMQNLGYQAMLESEAGLFSIKAANCVYHDLAQQYPEICQFDQALIEGVLERKIEQTACMAKQDCNCRFKLL